MKLQITTEENTVEEEEATAPTDNETAITTEDTVEEEDHSSLTMKLQ